MVHLHNDVLHVNIHPKGAELQSIQYNGREYLWSGDAAFWGKHSPVLFPIVGTLKNNTYFYNDKSYTLPRHGFAREMNFISELINDHKAIFTLMSNEDTLKNYPFPFTLKLIYELHNNKLLCTYEVINTGTEAMYFSVGAHPAFAVPLEKNLLYTDYTLSFNNETGLERFKLDNGLISQNTEAFHLTGKHLPLTHSLFYEDALVLKHLKSNSVTLTSQKSTHGLHFHFKDFPFLGIWAAKDAPFVCIEPWCGIADNVNHNQQLTEKEGIEKLALHTMWHRTWYVEFF